MNTPELVNNIALRSGRVSRKNVERSVNLILSLMTEAFEQGRRAEFRDFGSFTIRKANQRKSRNPKTDEPVLVPAKNKLHFKPGKELRERVNTV